MAEYIDKKQAINRIASCYCMDCEHSNGILCRACEHQDDMDLIDDMPTADVQPIVYAHKTINVGRRSYCSNCGKLAIMEDFCSKCGAKVKDGDTD